MLVMARNGADLKKEIRETLNSGPPVQVFRMIVLLTMIETLLSNRVFFIRLIRWLFLSVQKSRERNLGLFLPTRFPRCDTYSPHPMTRIFSSSLSLSFFSFKVLRKKEDRRLSFDVFHDHLSWAGLKPFLLWLWSVACWGRWKRWDLG